MNLNEHKGAFFGGVGALIAIIAVIANLAQILDWLGIKPREKQTANTSSSIIEVAVPENNNNDSSTLVEEIVETEAIAPPEDYEPKIVKLAELEYFNSSGNSAPQARSPKDNLGQSYTEALVIPSGYADGYVQYYINKKYTQLSGTIFLTYNSRSTRGDAIVEIRGDGVLLETFSFSGGELPDDFSVDIADVEVLEVRYSKHYDCFVGIDATLKTAE